MTCDRCLARTWLLGRMAGHLEAVRARVGAVLELADQELIDALGGRRRQQLQAELAALDLPALRARARAAGLETLCRCDRRYPPRLRALPAPPAALHVAGDLERFLALTAADPVAIVGTRRPSEYGLEVARSLGRGLAGAGVTVISGMALGIDCAAQAGALAAGGPTVAILPGGADRPYPRSKRALHARIAAAGAVVSELPPGAQVRRWAFPARNRIIAGLAAMTVVVEAAAASGALLTAGFARELQRPVGAVPGRITAGEARGANALLADGAVVIGGAQDVLDHLFGAGVREAQLERRAEVRPDLVPVLEAISAGHDTAAALARAGCEPEQGLLAALATLELGGHVRRTAGGRFAVIP